MSNIQFESNSPFSELALGTGFAGRATTWLGSAITALDDAIATDREMNGVGEEVSLTLSARQADHLSLGLLMLHRHFKAQAQAA
jgi:hypothetical protein